MAESGENDASALFHPSRTLEGSTPPRPIKRCGLGINFPDDAKTHTITDEGLRLGLHRGPKKVALQTAAPVPGSPSASSSAALPLSAPPMLPQKAESPSCENHALRPVRVLMPTVCDCGAPIVGCWYRKKAHWCEWFRHCRYEPLVSQFILQRSKSGRQNRSRPTFTPPPPTAAPSSTSSESDDSLHHPLWSEESIRETNEGWAFDAMGPPCSPTEVLGPDPLCVLCLTQFLKHKHAVQTAYCGDPTSAPSCSVEQLKTHVDCRNAKSYVHFKWYSSNIIHELKQQLGSPSEFNQAPSAIGCINIQHWNKKEPRTTDSLPQSSKELVQLDLEIEKVVSTFQVVHPEQDTVQVETKRRPDRSRILTWKGVDDMIWSTSAKLGLLSLDVIKHQRSVPFPLELARSDQSWSSCACKSDRIIAPKNAPVSVRASKANYSFIHVNALPEYMRPAADAMLHWSSSSTHVCGYHMIQIPHFEAHQPSQASLHSALPIKSEASAHPVFPNVAPVPSAVQSTSNVFESSPLFEIHPSISSLFQIFHASIDSGASAHDLEIESIFQASRLACPKSCRAIGLFLSIGSHPSDQTVLVTHCINSIQTNLQEVFSQAVSSQQVHQPESRTLPRVFVAVCIQGTFSRTDCDARLGILKNRLAMLDSLLNCEAGPIHSGSGGARHSKPRREGVPATAV